ncbi:MAG: hypothetical protein ABEI52_11245 [Halobacteriaceae archaeon]
MDTSSFEDSFGLTSLVSMVLGSIICAYGLLLLPLSVADGGWIIAIGLSMFLAGFCATNWATDRWNLSRKTQFRLSIGFSALALLLLVAFVVVNGVTFGGSEAMGDRPQPQKLTSIVS